MWRYNWIWRSVAHSSSWYFYIRVVYLLKRKYPIAPMKINTAIYIDQAFCHVLACQLRCSSFTWPFKSCILYNGTRFPSVLWVVKLRETRPKPHWNGREQFQSFQCARGGSPESPHCSDYFSFVFMDIRTCSATRNLIQSSGDTSYVSALRKSQP